MCHPNLNDYCSRRREARPSEGRKLLQRAGWEFVNSLGCLWGVVTCLTSELGQLYVTHIATEPIKINNNNNCCRAVFVIVSANDTMNRVGSKRVGVG